jgi:transposase
MGKAGVLPVRGEMWSPAGNAQLDGLELPEPYTIRLESLRDLMGIYEREVAKLERAIRDRLRGDPGYEAVQSIYGVGCTIAAIFCAETGDVARFGSAQALTSWAGLAPRHLESDTKVHRGPITRQGSKLVRWAAIEAVTGRRAETDLRRRMQEIAERRGKYKARAAAARRLLTLVYYGLRDAQIRCLQREPA